MKKVFLVLTLIFTFSSIAKTYKVTTRKVSVTVDFIVPKNFIIKKGYLNTPLLIWEKNLQAHGPSIGLFPIKTAPKGFANAKSVKTYFSKFKAEQQRNLLSLKATKIKFSKSEVLKNMLRFHLSYELGGVKIYMTESHKLCGKKGLKIRTIVKSKDTKKYYKTMDKLVQSIRCSN